MAEARYKRRNFFIDKRFQTNFILKFCIIVILACLLIGTLVFWFSQGSTTVAIENTKVQVKNTSDFLLPLLVDTVLLVTIFSALAVGILTLLISHKISGPLFRLNREVQAVGKGDLGRNFSIRADDQLQELSDNLNHMCIELRRNFVAVKQSLKGLNDYYEHNQASFSEDQKKKFRTLIDDMCTKLDYFKSE